MKWAIIFVICIFFALIGIGFGVYYGYEKPTKDNLISYVNISIIAKESQSGEIKNINYTISLDNINNIYSSGKTLRYDFILDKAPVNNTIFVYNSNENNTYYTDLHKIDYATSGNFRVIFDLIKPGKLTFEQQGELISGVDNEIIVTTFSDGFFREVKLCIRWSKHIINVNIGGGFNEISKIKKYENTDKCYKLSNSMRKGDSMLIPITYTPFGDIDSKDYIKLIIFDTDEVNEDWNNEIIYEIKK